MPEATISEILLSGQNYFVQYLANFNAVQRSFEDLRNTTFTVNKELNGLNATLSDSYSTLLALHATNEQNYVDSLSVLDEMIISGEGQILEAITGMVYYLKLLASNLFKSWIWIYRVGSRLLTSI